MAFGLTGNLHAGTWMWFCLLCCYFLSISRFETGWKCRCWSCHSFLLLFAPFHFLLFMVSHSCAQ